MINALTDCRNDRVGPALPGERLFRMMLDALPAAIYTTDAQGRLTYYNAAAVAFSGRVPELGSDQWCVSWKLFYPDGRPMRHEECPMAVAIREGRVVRGAEAIAERPDGTRIWFAPYPSPLKDERGTIIGGINMLVDITQTRRAEAALRESEERFRRLVKLLPVAVYTCEAPSGAITYYNDHAVQLWGRAPRTGDTGERFCGSWKLFLTDGTCLPHDQCPMAVSIRQGLAFRNQEVQIERPDGSRIMVLVNIDPIRDGDGRVIGAINVFHDTTALKQAEQALREADRRKDEFLATLSHELRSPLAPVAHSLELMKRANGDAALMEQARSTMERQLSQMVRLVDDLLDASRITRNRLELRKQRIELAPVVQQAVEACRPLADSRGHRIELDLPPQPVFLDGDPARLAQVFGNLLNNACKYTEQPGCIVLSARREDGEVVVRVKDNGIGIPAEMLPRVFDMFTQLGRTQDLTADGLGIGLALVKQLVQLHGGEVSVHSDGPGRGSEVTVRLPVLLGSPETAPAPKRNGRAMSPRRILVVDDNVDSAQSLSRLLALHGHEVRTAHDGGGAVEQAATFRPEVILLDIGLPRMSGYEVCRRIRSEPWGQGITMAALTGWGQDDDKARSREAGFDHHLVKPVDFTVLKELLAGQLNGRECN